MSFADKTALRSINGDSTAAQVIAASNPLQFTEAGATHTIGFKPPVTLTDGATITPDSSQGEIFYANTSGDRTFAAPTGSPVNGQIMEIWHRADTSARTPTFATGSTGAFSFNEDITSAMITATTANKMDVFVWQYTTVFNRWFLITYIKGNSA